MFCSRFLEGIETIFNKPRRIDDDIGDFDNYLGDTDVRGIGKDVNVRLDDKSLKQAHCYERSFRVNNTLERSFQFFPIISIIVISFLPRSDILHEWRQINNTQNQIIESDESKFIINEFGEWPQNQVH